MAANRRLELATHGYSNIPEAKEPPPHPGYSKHAAIEAIRRHAFNFIARDLTVSIHRCLISFNFYI